MQCPSKSDTVKCEIVANILSFILLKPEEEKANGVIRVGPAVQQSCLLSWDTMITWHLHNALLCHYRLARQGMFLLLPFLPHYNWSKKLTETFHCAKIMFAMLVTGTEVRKPIMLPTSHDFFNVFVLFFDDLFRLNAPAVRHRWIIVIKSRYRNVDVKVNQPVHTFDIIEVMVCALLHSPRVGLFRF